MIKKTKYFLVLLFFVSTFNILAQEFSASIDKAIIPQNERFQIYFTFKGTNLNKLKDFQAPSFNGLEILSGPNQSKSLQIINGQVSGSLTFSYIAVARNIGKYKIGSASVKFNGQTFNTKPLTFNVIKGNSTHKKVREDLGISEKELSQNLFIRAIPSKTTALLGEQITVVYKLYTRLNITSPQITKLPFFKGFWSEELETNNNINFGIEMYKGERYRSAVIKKVALFPTKTGVLTVTPFELNIPVVVRTKRRSRDIFDEFFNDSFFGRTKTVEHLTRSNKIKIKVLPLPSENVPATFTGAVGKFKLNVKLDKQNVNVNESITVKVRISGTGNIALLKLPELKLPAGFEKYEPKTTQNISKRNYVSGRKNIEYLIVPRVPGVKEIPPIEFTYFDLKKNKYITLSSEAFKVNVKAGKNDFTSNVSGYSKEDVKLLNKDIRFIKTSSFSFQRKEKITKIGVLFWLALLLPFIALITLYFVQKKQNKLAGNIKLIKFQKAEKTAKQQLKKAKKALETNNLADYYNYLSLALFGYLEDKLGLQKADFTLNKALEILKEKNAGEELITNIKQIADKCEFARFAPDAVGNDSDGAIYKNVEKVIENIGSIVSKKI